MRKYTKEEILTAAGCCTTYNSAACKCFSKSGVCPLLNENCAEVFARCIVDGAVLDMMKNLNRGGC